MSLRIAIRRDDGSVTVIDPAPFDDHPFADGDRLAVLPAAAPLTTRTAPGAAG